MGLGWGATRFCSRAGQTAESLHLDVADAADARLDALEVLAGQFLGQLDLHAEHQLLSLAASSRPAWA